MPTPVIDTLPAAPQRSDSPEQFSAKADAFAASLTPLVDQTNAAIDWQNTTLTATQQAKDQAAASAQAATDSASAASQSATQSSNYADASAQSATEAQSAVAALPEGTISDSSTAADKAWSSQKVSSALATKRDITNTSLPRYDLASAAVTDTLDLAQQQVFRVDASVARTLTFANEPGADRAMTVVVHIAGNSAVTWPASITWDSETAPELGATFTRIVLFWDGVEWTGGVGASR